MEDAHCIVDDLLKPSAATESQAELSPCSQLGHVSYFAVFDGHAGARAANFMRERFHELLAADAPALRRDAKGVLRAAFARADAEWLERACGSGDATDGTTAAVVLLDVGSRRCVVANLGDTEVVWGARARQGGVVHRVLSEVHDPKKNPAEVIRIRAAGGRVVRGRLAHPLFSPQAVSLGVSRAIGDIGFKDTRFTGGARTGLAHEPFVASFSLPPCYDFPGQFFIVACDGFWGSVKYSDAVQSAVFLMSSSASLESAAKGLVDLAVRSGSQDNVTVLLVAL